MLCSDGFHQASKVLQGDPEQGMFTLVVGVMTSFSSVATAYLIHVARILCVEQDPNHEFTKEEMVESMLEFTHNSVTEHEDAMVGTIKT